MDPLENSTLLLYLENSVEPMNRVRFLLDKLILKFPLSIQICGENSEIYFDYLLEKLSISINEKHTMTFWDNENDINECILNFFTCSYPSEEGFEEWNEYRVIVLCEELAAQKILNSIKNYLKN